MNIKIRNRSPHVIKNITLDWSINDEPQTPILIQDGIPKNFDYTVTVDLPENTLDKYKDYTIKVDVSDIDGQPDQIMVNSRTEQVVTVENPSTLNFPRKIVMEEGTALGVVIALTE